MQLSDWFLFDAVLQRNWKKKHQGEFNHRGNNYDHQSFYLVYQSFFYIIMQSWEWFLKDTMVYNTQTTHPQMKSALEAVTSPNRQLEKKLY